MNKRKNKVKIVTGMLTILIIISLIGPFIALHNPYETNLLNTLQSPSLKYPFGTDSLGRCVYSRVLYGMSRTIFSSLILVSITFIFGSLVGIISGYLGGIIDDFIMIVINIFLALPSMVLAIAIAGILGGGMVNALIALVVVSWPKYANLARGEVLTVKEEVYIQAAKLSGNSNFHILIKHIIPNIYGKLLVVGTLDIGTIIMELSGLSFLGLCSPLPLAELGSMMSEGKSYIQFAPWLILAPGITILIIVIIFNIFGDTMQELINSKKNRG